MGGFRWNTYVYSKGYGELLPSVEGFITSASETATLQRNSWLAELVIDCS